MGLWNLSGQWIYTVLQGFLYYPHMKFHASIVLQSALQTFAISLI
jgi:hypothetical protein